LADNNKHIIIITCIELEPLYFVVYLY